MNITFIGGGNMASALIGGLLQQGHAATSLRVVDVSQQARDAISKRYGVAVFADLAQGCTGAEVIILAVKPQQMREVAVQLGPNLSGQIVLSIAAGIRLKDLMRWLGTQNCTLVRAMPNTPALIGAGITGLAFYNFPPRHIVTPQQRKQIEAVMSAVGGVLWVRSEEDLDAVTAVSGSGPAYVFYFIEALQQAAKELGFDDDQAKKLVLATFSGAVKLAEQGEDVQILRQRVTSKGGTTERALASMAADQVKEAIVRAIRAAAERSRELGDEFGKAD
jgi:pyrroline-5-carboxylate reductase